MRIATGKVVDGKVVVEGAALVEGATVTVLVREGAETFEASPEQEAELLMAIGEAEHGEMITGEKLLEGLRRGA
jgi:hypothetical protein